MLIVAKRRGALVIAFGPAFASYGYLCENVLLNGCEASVVPVPLAVAAKDDVAEIKYQQGPPGEPGYVLRNDIVWVNGGADILKS